MVHPLAATPASPSAPLPAEGKQRHHPLTAFPALVSSTSSSATCAGSATRKAARPRSASPRPPPSGGGSSPSQPPPWRKRGVTHTRHQPATSSSSHRTSPSSSMVPAARGRRATAFLRTLMTNLLSLARHWVKSASDELAQLVALQRKLGTTPAGLTAATERVLRELTDPATRAALLALPDALAEDARAGRHSPARRRQLARTAVAIELLLHTGMRLHQLATLRISEHVSWPDGPQGALRISAPDRHTRDGTAQEFELVGAPQRLVEDYLQRYGVHVSRRQPQPPLFTHANGTRVTDAALADGIAKATLRGLGLRITPSDLRHHCAALILDAWPDDFATVKDLLGNQFLESTIAQYGGRRRHSAGAAWNARLAQESTPPTPPKALHAASV